jgi:hypothetical protein
MQQGKPEMKNFETIHQLEAEISKARSTIERCKAKGRVMGAKSARSYLRELMNLRANNYAAITH